MWIINSVKILIVFFIIINQNILLADTAKINDSSTSECASSFFIEEFQDRLVCFNSYKDIAACSAISIGAGAIIFAKPLALKILPSSKLKLIEAERIVRGYAELNYQIEIAKERYGDFNRVYAQLSISSDKNSARSYWYKNAKNFWDEQILSLELKIGFYSKKYGVGTTRILSDVRTYTYQMRNIRKIRREIEDLERKLGKEPANEKLKEYKNKLNDDMKGVYEEISDMKIRKRLFREIRKENRIIAKELLDRSKVQGIRWSGITLTAGGFVVLYAKELLDLSAGLRCPEAKKLSEEGKKYVHFNIKCEPVLTDEKALQLTLLEEKERKKILKENQLICNAVVARNKTLFENQIKETPKINPKLCSKDKMIFDVSVNGNTYTHTYVKDTNIKNKNVEWILNSSFFPNYPDFDPKKYKFSIPLEERDNRMQFGNLKTKIGVWYYGLTNLGFTSDPLSDVLGFYNSHKKEFTSLSLEDQKRIQTGDGTMINKMYYSVGEQLTAIKRSFSVMQNICAHLVKQEEQTESSLDKDKKRQKGTK